jgi:aspartyl-tRNA(Asn)/glutamyl-tRNA(Gln) amidotransferase subunit C
MPERLSKEEVEHIAALAHLELDDREKELFSRQLAEILTYAQQVRELDTTGVVPTSHVLTRQPADREDQVRPCLTRAAALANAPEPAMAAGLFKVPRVIS